MKESESDGFLAAANDGVNGSRSSSLPRGIRPASLSCLQDVDVLKGVCRGDSCKHRAIEGVAVKSVKRINSFPNVFTIYFLFSPIASDVSLRWSVWPAVPVGTVNSEILFFVL